MAPVVEPGFEFGATLPGAPTVLSGVATDNDGVEAVKIAIRDRTTRKWLQDDGTWGPFHRFTTTLTDQGAPSTEWTYLATLPSGPYSLSARVWDVAGNSASISPWHHFVVENTAPPVITRDFEFGATFTDSPIVLSGQVTTPVGIDRVAVAIRDRTVRFPRLWLQPDGTWGPFHRFDMVLSDPGGTASSWHHEVCLPAGEYTLSVRAWDVDGNTDSLSPWRQFDVVESQCE